MKEFSEEDLKELDKIAQKFEKKLKEFELDTKSENEIQVILKGHLYIEYELRELLRKTLIHPNILKVHKLKFAELVKLVFSLGLLPLELIETVWEINNLRNKYSHNLKYNLSVLDYRILEETFSDHFREHYLGFLKTRKEPINELAKIQTVLFTMWEIVNSYNDIPDYIKEKLI